jgi:hypothetical protein
MRGHVGSGVRSHLPESDGISDKFDYVKLRNDAQNLPECQLVLNEIGPSRNCQLQRMSLAIMPSRAAIPA